MFHTCGINALSGSIIRFIYFSKVPTTIELAIISDNGKCDDISLVISLDW